MESGNKKGHDSNFTFAQNSKRGKNQSSFFPQLDSNLRAVDETSSVESQQISGKDFRKTDLVESLEVSQDGS